MLDFAVPLSDIAYVGRGLRRPECVVCTKSGATYVPDWVGGISVIKPGGQVEAVHSKPAEGSLRPNSIALRRDGSFLLANLHDEAGGVWELHPGGEPVPWLLSVDGIELPPTNFVLADDEDRIWITVSTRRRPRSLGYRADVADGFIVLVDAKGPRIVADGLGYTNEVRLDAAGRHLYVVETFGRRITRFHIGANGALTGRSVLTTFGHGTYPDGIAFDAQGALWVTSIVSNRVIRVFPDGVQSLVLEDCDTAYVDGVEEAYQKGFMGPSHMNGLPANHLHNISSIAFGGPDLRTVYLGCLAGDRLATFQSPVPGLAMAHWHWVG